MAGVDVNRYAYANYDPINLSDPNGHSSLAAPSQEEAERRTAEARRLAELKKLQEAAAKLARKIAYADERARQKLLAGADPRVAAEATYMADRVDAIYPSMGPDYLLPTKLGPKLLMAGIGGLMAKNTLKETTTLFRAVGEAEAKAVARTGKFEVGPNSLGGKWVAEKEADARKWGDLMNGKGKSEIVEVTMDKAKADQLIRMERLDNIGPARYGEIDQFNGATLRIIDR